MNLYKFAAIVLITLLSLVTGCVSPGGQIVDMGPEPETGHSALYYYYLHTNKVQGAVVNAMVSYLSMAIAKSEAQTYDRYQDVVSAYFDGVVETGRVHENYPRKPTGEELHIARVLADSWLFEAKGARIDPREMRFDFFTRAENFIGFVQDVEWEKYKTSGEGWPE